MAQKLNTGNWKLEKFKETARVQIMQTSEHEEVLTERYLYACKNLCSLLEHQIMEDCHRRQFGFRKARGCIISYIQLQERAATLPPFSL